MYAPVLPPETWMAPETLDCVGWDGDSPARSSADAASRWEIRDDCAYYQGFTSQRNRPVAGLLPSPSFRMELLGWFTRFANVVFQPAVSRFSTHRDYGPGSLRVTVHRFPLLSSPYLNFAYPRGDIAYSSGEHY
jgi:hypothetical protein